MDDLKLLGIVLAQPDPAPEMADRSRRRLRKTMRGRKRRRGTGWLVTALGLAAAATVAVVVASGTTAPITPEGPSAAAQPSARQVLLAAAATAENAPEDAGTYWHVTTVHDPPHRGVRRTEIWFRRDGQIWMSLRPGSVRRIAPSQVRSLGITGMSFGQLQHLPTDPVALREWIRDALKRQREKEEPGNEYPPNTLEVNTAHVINDLLFYLPAPPKVRAAAFRALASLPDVKRIGAVKEGQVLVFSSGGAGMRMIIDPRTARVGIENFSPSDDGREWMDSRKSKGEWTDEMPG
jgi:hypothetical protein